MPKPAIASSFLLFTEIPEIRESLVGFRRASGETVFQEGGRPEAVFFLERGLVKLVKYSPKETIPTLDVIGPGRPFGMVAVLDRKPYPVSAVVVGDARLYQLSAAKFHALMERHAAFARAIYTEIGVHVRNTQELRVAMGESVSARLVRVLCLLIDSIGPEIRLSREEVASIAGMTEGSVVRELADLRRAGLVATVRKRISIPRPGALRARLNSFR